MVTANNFTNLNSLTAPSATLLGLVPITPYKNSLKITNNIISLSFQAIQASTYSSNSSAISINGKNGLPNSCVISSNSIPNRYDSASYPVGIYLGKDISANITDNNISDFQNAGIFCSKATGDVGIISNNIISRAGNNIFSYISGGSGIVGPGGITPNTSSALVVDNYFDSNSISSATNDYNVVKNRGSNWVVERNKNQREVMYLTADCGLAGLDYTNTGNPIIFRNPYTGNTAKAFPTYYLSSQSPQSPSPTGTGTGYDSGSLIQNNISTTGSSGGNITAYTTPRTVGIFTSNIGDPNTFQPITGVWQFSLTAFASSSQSGDNVRFRAVVFTWDDSNNKVVLGLSADNNAILDGYTHEYNLSIPVSGTLFQNQRIGVEILAWHTGSISSGNPEFTIFYGGSYSTKLVTNISTFKQDYISAPIGLNQGGSAILTFYSSNLSSNNKSFYWNVNPRKIIPNGVKIVEIEQDVEQTVGSTSVAEAQLIINKYVSNNYYQNVNIVSLDALNTRKTIKFTESTLGNNLRLNTVYDNLYTDIQYVISITLLVAIPAQSTNETFNFSAYPMKLTYEW